MKIHVISDLYLGYNEFSTEEEQIPDVDLVIINGNVGLLKRSMYYVETLCNKYPDIQFVVNLGQIERCAPEKYIGELEDNISIRVSSNPTWPKNLYWGKKPAHIVLRNGLPINLLCTYGYPLVMRSIEPWETTDWYRFHAMNYVDANSIEGSRFKPAETSDVPHGVIPIPASIDYINQEHEKELVLVRNWENTAAEGQRILVTHVNQYNDKRFAGIKVKPYLIHLHQGIWISSNTECNGLMFLGGKLYSNPGRGSNARDKVITVN